jgi:hypothetical protein
LSGPNNADPAKLPRRVVKRPVIGGGAALLLSDFYVKVRCRDCQNRQRQSATTDRSCTYLSDDERAERRRPGNFTAEVSHKVLNGVIAVQRRHRSSSAASFAGQPCAASLMTAALQPALDRALLAGLHPLMSRVAVEAEGAG